MVAVADLIRLEIDDVFTLYIHFQCQSRRDSYSNNHHSGKERMFFRHGTA